MLNLVTNFLTRSAKRTKISEGIRELAHIEFKYETPEYVAYLVNSGQIYKNKIDKYVI